MDCKLIKFTMILSVFVAYSTHADVGRKSSSDVVSEAKLAPLYQAFDAKIDGQTQYFRELRKAPRMSTESRRELKEKYIDKPEKDLKDARAKIIEEERSSFLRDLKSEFADLTPQEIVKIVNEADKDPEDQKADAESEDSKDSNEAVASVTSPKTAQNGRFQIRTPASDGTLSEETQEPVDGSGLPKVIEFKKKATPKTNAAIKTK